MSNFFGYMDYNPNITHQPMSGDVTKYEICPIDIQVCYKKLFDIYCGAFTNEQGEFISLLRIYNGDYRRTVISIETKILAKEAKEMTDLFETKLD